MTLQQLSLFLENRPGTLVQPVRALGDAGINLLSLHVADSSEFGILRLIVREVDKARDVLVKAGCIVNITDVLALDVPDSPGGLAGVLDVLDRAKLEIEYVYPFTAAPRGNRAALIFRFEDTPKAIDTLKAAGVQLLDIEALVARAIQ